MPMYGTQRWLLGLEDFPINALHIVDDRSEREGTLEYISEIEMAIVFDSDIQRRDRN